MNRQDATAAKRTEPSQALDELAYAVISTSTPLSSKERHPGGSFSRKLLGALGVLAVHPSNPIID
jgi:hypothetical protein